MADSGHPPAELHERLLICRTIKLNAGAHGGHRRCCLAQMQKNAQNKPQIARLILCVHTTLQVYCNLFLTFCGSRREKGRKKSRENSVSFSSFSLAKTFLMCYNQTKKLKILYKNRHFRQMNFPKISFFSCPSDWFPSLVVYRKGSDSNVLISPETIHVPLLTTSCIKIINKGALS